LRDYVVLNNKRESIKREVLKNYDIDNKGYDESIEREVKILSLAELEKLQKRTDLDTFLSKVLGKNKPEPKELLNIFSQIK
jgi:ribosomal protein L15